LQVRNVGEVRLRIDGNPELRRGDIAVTQHDAAEFGKVPGVPRQWDVSQVGESRLEVLLDSDL
jgi:hypothetical protein